MWLDARLATHRDAGPTTSAPPTMPSRSRLRPARLALLAASTLLAACATPSASYTARSDLSNVSHHRRDVIGTQELGNAPRSSALDAIRRLRPEYMRTELGARAGAAPVVYVDGARWGGMESLSTIPAHLVLDVRRLRPVEARLRYGPDVAGSVIEVRLLRPVRAGMP